MEKKSETAWITCSHNSTMDSHIKRLYRFETDAHLPRGISCVESERESECIETLHFFFSINFRCCEHLQLLLRPLESLPPRSMGWWKWFSSFSLRHFFSMNYIYSPIQLDGKIVEITCSARAFHEWFSTLEARATLNGMIFLGSLMKSIFNLLCAEPETLTSPSGLSMKISVDKWFHYCSYKSLNASMARSRTIWCVLIHREEEF